MAHHGVDVVEALDSTAPLGASPPGSRSPRLRATRCAGEVAARTVVVAMHLDRTVRKARSFSSDLQEPARALIEG